MSALEVSDIILMPVEAQKILYKEAMPVPESFMAAAFI
jgi:hypothetical protein